MPSTYRSGIVNHLSRPLLLLLVFALFCTAVLGCGRKQWPEPKAEGERFSIRDATAELQDGCLTVRGRLSGAHGNLDRMVLELAETGEGASCPTCPFHAETRVQSTVDETAPDANFRREGRRFIFRHCGLTPGVIHRWRLVGYNSYPGIAPEVTRAYLNEPE